MIRKFITRLFVSFVRRYEARELDRWVERAARSEAAKRQVEAEAKS